MTEQITLVEPTTTDFTLVFPDEATWDAYKEDAVGDIDIIGVRNNRYLVNVRGTIPEDAKQYSITLDTPLRVWA